jgi:hypothetical protein
MSVFDWVNAIVPINALTELGSEIGGGMFAYAGAVAYVAAAEATAKMNGNLPLKSLDEEQKRWLRSNFASLVDRVHVIYNASLIPYIEILNTRLYTSKLGMTFGDRIYLNFDYVPGNEDLLIGLSHEMVHVRQFHNLDRSLFSFGKHYFRGFFESGFSYTGNRMEVEAYNFEECFKTRFKSPISVPEIWRETWTKGWTNFMPFVLNNRSHYLAYKTHDGTVNIDRVRDDAQGVDTIWPPDPNEKWSTAWTSFVPFMLNGQPHYLAYKVDNGEVQIDRIRPDGKGIDNIWKSTWKTGWTSFVPFTLNGTPHYIAYKMETGEVDFDRIRPDGLGADTIAETKWTKGWTSFVPFQLNNRPHYLSYKLGTGEVDIDRIWPDGKGVDTIGEAKWTTGWTSLIGFTLNGKPHILSYKGPFKSWLPPYGFFEQEGSGYTHVDRIKDDGSGTEVIWCDEWTGNWTSFVPFELSGVPHHLAYKAEEGTAAIDIVHVK